MKRHQRRSAFIIISVLTLGLFAPAADAAPDAKKITISQAKKLYADAAAAAVRWQETNPFTHTLVVRDGGKTVTNTTLTIDSSGNFRIVEKGKVLMLGIGMINYIPLASSDFADFELSLARKIGMNFDLEWVRVDAAKIAPEYEPWMLTDEFRAQAAPSITFARDYDSRRSTATLRSIGVTKTVTVVTKRAGSQPASTDTFTITSGRLVASTSKRGSESIAMTVKPTSSLLIPPSGPFFEWATVVLHPEYQAGRTLTIASLRLEMLVREATALAAFDGRNTPSSEDWLTITSENEALVLYDKGVEFSVDSESGESYSYCGSFTSNGATISAGSCSALGYIRR